MPQIHFETLGCKLNQIESESVARSFIDANFSAQMENSTAEGKTNKETILCIINTCTVTSKAEQKARRIFRLLLQKFPNAILIITGCYAQLDGLFIESMDERIIVLPGQKKDFLVFLPQFLQENPSILAPTSFIERKNAIKTFFTTKNQHFSENNEHEFLLSTDTFLQHSRASIKIQDGCNNHCTYCRIRLARGKSISLSPTTILERIKKLEENNQQEVVITGVNLSQYAHHFDDGTSCDLASLLDFILKNTKNIAIRISSLYPQRVDSALCEILNSPRIQPHFHLSIQSGSEKILSVMNRPYKKEHILKAIERIRTIKPEAFLACDIIVGFPGETEEDFLQTYELCKQCNFSWIHIFPFSPRPGTEAFSMQNQIPSAIKNERVKKLTQLAEKQNEEYLQLFVGKNRPAIIEKRTSSVLKGVTDNFIHFEVTNTKNTALQGKSVTVTITNCAHKKDIDAYGEII